MESPDLASHPTLAPALEPQARTFYQDALLRLKRSGIPSLVGGAYAFERYTGIARHTKDLDVFIRPADREHVITVLSAAGYGTDLSFAHWLGKAFYGEHFIDVVFGSGNGLCNVDDEWFAHAPESTVMGVDVPLCPAEEMIWSKSFIQERERFDGADVAHLLHSQAEQLDWPRLLRRFADHWRVLLAHLILFGFIYPAERDRIPHWVMDRLLQTLSEEMDMQPLEDRVCQGTLLSREQYLTDVTAWSYEDSRLTPRGSMSREQIAHWTAAIDSPG